MNINIKQEFIIKASQSTDATRRVVHFPGILKNQDNVFHCDISQAIQTTGPTAYDAFHAAVAELVKRVDSSTIIYSLENKSISLLGIEKEKELLKTLLGKEIDIA